MSFLCYGFIYTCIKGNDHVTIISCQIEEFIAEAEAIGHVRHKNLVKLLGYCMEEGYR